MINVEDFKKNLIIKALQGKLTEQIPSEGTALDVLDEIVKTKSTTKKKWTILHVDENDLPFDIPQSWTWCYLESISDSLGGKSNQIQSSEIKEKGEIPVVSQGKRFIDGYTLFTSKIITDVPVVLFGDHTKVVKFIDFPFVIGADGTKILQSICLDNKFFYYLITYASFTIFNLGYSRHFSLLKKCPLPIPPLKEQKRIADKLDVIFAELDKIDEKQTRLATIQEKMVAKILKLAIQGKLVEQHPEEGTGEELFKLIQEEKQELIKQGKIKKEKPLPAIEDYEIPFEIPSTWKWVRLSDICEIPITDGTHQTPTYSSKDGGVPFISSKDVTTKTINWNNIKYITKDLHKELYKRIAPQKNDILLAKNGTTGVAALVDDDRVFDIYVTLAVLRPTRNLIYPKFLLNVVNSPVCKSQFNEHLIGIGVPNLHLNVIKEVMIPLPPFEEQKRIVEKIEELLQLCRGN